MTKILIIEDDSSLSQLYQTMFEDQEFAVLTASDGQQGIDTAVRERPAVILLDILMPKVNGFDVLKSLKNQVETKNIPIIIASNLGSSDSNANRQLALSLGAADYLVKALNEPQAIVDRVRQVVNQPNQTAETVQLADGSRPITIKRPPNLRPN